MARIDDEVWETTTEGWIWVSITNSKGDLVDTRVGGKVGQKLRISKDDRERLQEMVQDTDHDPFTNGLLAQRSGDKPAPRNDLMGEPLLEHDQALTVETLASYFASNGNAFQAKVKPLNETNLRRLLSMSEDLDASVKQVEFIKAQLEPYRRGGTQPAYAETVGIGR